MKLLDKKIIEQVTQIEYVLQHETEGIIYYKEQLDKDGVVIDYQMLSKHGYEIEDWKLKDEVWDMVDKLEKQVK
jgi:hypothetical protein